MSLNYICILAQNVCLSFDQIAEVGILLYSKEEFQREKCSIITFDVLGAPTCGPTFYDYPSQWTGGANGNFYLRFPVTVSTWKVTVQFSSSVNSLSVWNGANSACAGSTCTFTDAGYNAIQALGASLPLGFQVKFIEV